jgi:hypothetical protein
LEKILIEALNDISKFNAYEFFLLGIVLFQFAIPVVGIVWLIANRPGGKKS